MSSFDPLTPRIIRAAFRVHNILGPGYLEHIYRNALALELRKMGHRVLIEVPLRVDYEGNDVGRCDADLIVDDIVVVETKATEAIQPGHRLQLRAYLRTAGYEIGLVLNFGPMRVDVNRVEETRVRRRSG